jgi:hypothetical protein
VLSHHLFFFNSVAVGLSNTLKLSPLVFLNLDPGNVFLLGNNLLFHLVFLSNPGVMVAFLLFILFGLDLGLLGFFVLAQLDGFLHLFLLHSTILFNIVVSLGNDSLSVSFHLSFIHSLPESLLVALFKT